MIDDVLNIIGNIAKIALNLDAKHLHQYECQTVAFPSISTGAYGFPLELAAPIALKEISQFLAQPREVKEVRMVLFDVAALEAFQKTFAQLQLG